MPAAASVELTDELQQPRAGGVEMSGELGDLVAQSLELRNRFRRRPNGAVQVAVHRRLSSFFVLRRLYTAIFETSSRRQDERSLRDPDFFDGAMYSRAARCQPAPLERDARSIVRAPRAGGTNAVK